MVVKIADIGFAICVVSIKDKKRYSEVIKYTTTKVME
jgi:hypothetical protein